VKVVRIFFTDTVCGILCALTVMAAIAGDTFLTIIFGTGALVFLVGIHKGP